MVLNITVFKTRAVSAIAFAVIMLAGVLIDFRLFFLLFTVIHLGCWLEFQKLLMKIYPPYSETSAFHRYGIIIAGWCLMLNFTSPGLLFLGIPLQEIGWWLGLTLSFLIPLTDLLLGGNINGKNLLLSISGLVYISLSIALLVAIYNSNFFSDKQLPAVHQHFLFPLLIICCIWINDTMAYISGSLIGKTPLSSISPKKTREGTLGGILLAVGVITLVMAAIYPSVPIWFWIAFSSIVAITGTIGDLVESKLKRMAGVKDSGNLMPGHGGFLDRFDSLLLAIPFIWIFLKLVYYY